MAETAILSVTATNGSNLANLPVKNGQIIFVQDKHKLAFDLDDKRVVYSEIIDISTEAGRTSLLAPVSGCYYFVVETSTLWTYRNGAWVQITMTPAVIVDGSVTTAKIADGAVTTDKIGSYAVTQNKLAGASVGPSQLAASAVETAAIKNGAVTGDKLASSFRATLVTTSQLGDVSGIVDGAETVEDILINFDQRLERTVPTSSAITLTGIDEDDVVHTWTIYGVAN